MKNGSAVPVERDGAAVRFESVSFAYTTSAPILNSASFHIHEGEFAALVGPNGGGKTSVLRLILGLENPLSGSIRIFGMEAQAVRSLVGYLPQQALYDKAFPISVAEVVAMGALYPASFGGLFAGGVRRALKNPAVCDALRQVDISDIAVKQYASLSGGQRRRVLLARALAAEPRLLVLDEPSANMDSDSEKRLLETLAALKSSITILLVTHDKDFVTALADSIFCVGERGGGIVQHKAERVQFSERLHVLHDTQSECRSCLCDGETV